MSVKEPVPEKYGALNVVNVRLVREPSPLSDRQIICTQDAVEEVCEMLKDFDREVFCVLNLATDGTPLGLNIASIGTLNSALISPREVFKSSILSNAAACIAFHCHPSGSVRPSMDDAHTTQRLKDAGELLDIKLIDHIIVGCGTGKSYSFKGNGLLDAGDVVGKYSRMFNGRER